MSKRIFALIMSAVMLLSVFCINLQADSDVYMDRDRSVENNFDAVSTDTAIKVMDMGTVSTEAEPAIEALADSVESGSSAATQISGTRDALILIDTSGSMSGERAANAVKYAKTYSEYVLKDSGSRIALMSFDSDATLELGFTSDYSEVEEILNSVYFYGYTTRMDTAFIEAEEYLRENAENENIEIYFITDGFPINGKVEDDINQFSKWVSNYNVSYYVPYAEWVYNYVKNNLHNKYYVKTQGIYYGTEEQDDRDFVTDFLEALANPPGNSSVDFEEPTTTEVTTEEEEETETTTKASKGGSVSIGGGGGTAKTVGKTEKDTENNGDVYINGILKDVPTLSSYTINDAETAAQAMENTIDEIVNENLSLEENAVVNQIANFAEEAVALTGVANVETNNIDVSGELVSELGEKSIEAKNAVKEAIGGKSVDIGRDIRTDVTINTSSVDTLNVKFDSASDFSDVDYVNVQTPLCRVSFNNDMLSENENLEVAIEYSSLKENGSQDGISTANSYDTAFKITASQEITDGMFISIKPKAGDNIDNLTIVNSEGETVLNKYDYINQEMCAFVSSGDTYYIERIEDNEAQASAYNKLNDLNLTPLKSTVNFKDIENLSSYEKQTIAYLYKSGILSGQTSTTFAPNDTLSRAEFTVFLLRSTGQYDAKQKGNGGFSDVQGWAEPVVSKAKALGVISGYNDGTFRPDANISKEQVYQILGRSYTTINMGISISGGDVTAQLNKFKDSADIAFWAKNNVALCSKRGIITRNSDNTFLPKKGLKRIDAAVAIRSFFDDLPFKSRR